MSILSNLLNKKILETAIAKATGKTPPKSKVKIGREKRNAKNKLARKQRRKNRK